VADDDDVERSLAELDEDRQRALAERLIGGLRTLGELDQGGVHRGSVVPLPGETSIRLCSLPSRLPSPVRGV
jgi:hypothetical protein